MDATRTDATSTDAGQGAATTGVEVVLIPGFWLDDASWAPVTDALERAGHHPHPVTPQGVMRAADADDAARAVRLADQAAAVTDLVDALTDSGAGPVVLVGHSGGGAVAHAVVDARPDRIAWVVYVDAGPLGDGGVVNDALPTVDGRVPLPDWSFFEDAELDGMTPEIRSRVEDLALTVPAAVAAGPQRLSADERRYAVPVTVISSTMPEAVLRQFMDGGHPYVAELARIEQVEIVELPTGHWPQLSRPDELADLVVAAVDRVGDADLHASSGG
ncbi:alpha/beta fold hydrolase [Nakamurella leprariae]|uniref:Alpha/beta hydrolase n=1 Tax=Nakamurella leprariae TaxID=2803911 RepID=A0A939C2H4_9ACTN|nr:alpha/beta hydrolase [Nakamurella leprariae]MBM9468117.1 alpha/beta hydrolase [Nakamurella leprariae]